MSDRQTGSDVKVIETHDDEREARIRADDLWVAGRRVGVMTTLEWNRYHPERQVRTVNRYVIYEEKAG